MLAVRPDNVGELGGYLFSTFDSFCQSLQLIGALSSFCFLMLWHSRPEGFEPSPSVLQWSSSWNLGGLLRILVLKLD